MTCCSSCKCLHLSVGGIRTWAFLLGLIQVGTFACHFYAKTPFTEITQLLGNAPTQAEQNTLWAFLGFITLLRFVFAFNPMCRNTAQFTAIVHWIEFFPMAYYATINILLNYKTLSTLHLAGGAAIVAFSFLNANIFYNYWMDRLTGEIRSTTVSLSRGSSVAAAATTTASSRAKKLAPPARTPATPAAKKKSASSAATTASEPSVAASSATPVRKSTSRASSTPAKKKAASASPKKKAATPAKKKTTSASKSRSSSKKKASSSRAGSKKKK